jgi:hypothetical protein
MWEMWRFEMKELRALTNFFWNGILVREGEILEGDREFCKQVVDEERLCELYNQSKGGVE